MLDIIILDWDDTLFPTNWITKNKINLSNQNQTTNYVIYFEQLDRILSELLKKISGLGKLIIVTNALPSWIELSSIILPKTFLILKGIRVISARKQFRHITPNIMDWKKMAFRELVDELNDSVSTNIISVGDAEYEYEALISLDDNKKILKTVKFVKDPSYEIIIDQLNVLYDAIPSIVRYPNHLDLILSPIKSF